MEARIFKARGLCSELQLQAPALRCCRRTAVSMRVCMTLAGRLWRLRIRACRLRQVFASRSALLIDGDLRRSSLTAAAPGSAEGAGLIEILLGQAEVSEAIRSIQPPKPLSAGSISFMPAGRGPPTSLGAVNWSKAASAFKSI